jgi:hypothetical protein
VPVNILLALVQCAVSIVWDFMRLELPMMTKIICAHAGVNVDDDAFSGDVKLLSTTLPYDPVDKFLRNGKSGHIQLGK